MFHEQPISKGQIWLSSNWSCVRSFFSLYLQYVLFAVGKGETLCLNAFPSWWLNQPPIWKICASQIGTFPQGSGWKFTPNIWETPAPDVFGGNPPNWYQQHPNGDLKNPILNFHLPSWLTYFAHDWDPHYKATRIPWGGLFGYEGVPPKRFAKLQEPLLKSRTWVCFLIYYLVGGWTNPSENYSSKWESSPIFQVKIKEHEITT